MNLGRILSCYWDKFGLDFPYQDYKTQLPEVGNRKKYVKNKERKKRKGEKRKKERDKERKKERKKRKKERKTMIRHHRSTQ